MSVKLFKIQGYKKNFDKVSVLKSELTFFLIHIRYFKTIIDFMYYKIGWKFKYTQNHFEAWLTNFDYYKNNA